MSVVHIGEHTLSKRLYEFASTTASRYTADEFVEAAKAIEADEKARLDAAAPAAEPAGLLDSAGCEHLSEPGARGGGAGQWPRRLTRVGLTRGPAYAPPPAAGARSQAHFAHGMCKDCYLEFLVVSGWCWVLGAGGD